MKETKEIRNLAYFTETAVSPFHTVEAVRNVLHKEEFEELPFSGGWKLERGGKYLVSVYDSLVFAFTVGKEWEPGDGLRMAAAHGDFPGFRVKPCPEVRTGDYVRLNVETYGGVNLMSWLDRPLSLAGRVALRSADVFRPELRLVDFREPLLVIPNIAIHMERDLNKGIELNRQVHMLPLFALDQDQKEDVFTGFLAEKLGVKKEDILDYELNVYNPEKGAFSGPEGEFYSSPRLDNLTSVSALVDGITAGGRDRGVNLMVVFDHEEVGSQTKQGAGSTVFPLVLEKIYGALGSSRTALTEVLPQSMLLPVDVSHAMHPAYEAKNDITSKNMPGRGFAIKEACSQSYATDSRAVAVVQQICDSEKIPCQKYVNRSDIAGGGTLGSIASAILPVPTVDMGVPLLAMHSSRELMGTRDQESLCEMLRAYYTL